MVSWFWLSRRNGNGNHSGLHSLAADSIRRDGVFVNIEKLKEFCTSNAKTARERSAEHFNDSSEPWANHLREYFDGCADAYENVLREIGKDEINGN